MKKSILCLFVLVLCLFTMQPVLGAMVIDGNLNDWGLNALSGPSSDWGKTETWLPSAGIGYIVEDNNNPLQTGLPGFERPGVHITGSGTTFQFYNENPITLNSGHTVTPPWAGEYYDLQALYMTQDVNTIYVAVVVSTPQAGISSGGSDDQPGDLALNFGIVPGEKYDYEYGVKLGTRNSVGDYQPGDIVYLPDWQDIGYITPAIPDVMKSPSLPGGGKVGSAQIAYTGTWLNHEDNGFPNYVIELAIPKQAVGNPGNIGLNSIQIAQNCQNDQLYVPEFPTIAFSLALIFGLVYVIFIMKDRKKI
jgi:hypothetical protein